MTCYPTWCTKPEFVKPQPAPKRSNVELTLTNDDNQGALPLLERSNELIIDEDTGGEMSFSCGTTPPLRRRFGARLGVQGGAVGKIKGGGSSGPTVRQYNPFN